MVAEGDNEQLMLMWTVANELLEISNDNEENCRLEEFRKRFKEVRHQEEPVLSMNTSRNNRRTRSSVSKAADQQVNRPNAKSFLEKFLFLLDRYLSTNHMRRIIYH